MRSALKPGFGNTDIIIPMDILNNSAGATPALEVTMETKYSLVDAFFLFESSVNTFGKALEKAEGSEKLKESLGLLHRQARQLVAIHRSAVDRAQVQQGSDQGTRNLVNP